MGNRTCSLDGCDEIHLAKGFCGPHYNRWKRHGDPLKGRVLHAGKTCEVQDCDEPISARSWCRKHYGNWFKTGEPVRPRAKRAEIPSGADAVRVCTSCNETKSLDEFSPSKLGKYGRRPSCKACQRQAVHEKREADRTKPPLWARRPVGTPGTAWCSKCKVFKESKLFRLDPRNSDGFRSNCIDCDRETAARRDRSNDKRTLLQINDPATAAAIARRNVLLMKYGMTPEDYDNLLAFQGGRCAICGSEKARHGRKTYFHVDHDHDTKEVRGLLCSPCNTGIGGLKDSPELLRRALSYLAFSPFKALVEQRVRGAAA